MTSSSPTRNASGSLRVHHRGERGTQSPVQSSRGGHGGIRLVTTTNCYLQQPARNTNHAAMKADRVAKEREIPSAYFNMMEG